MQKQEMVMAVAVVATLCTGMDRAVAQLADAKAAAEQLFAQGRALMMQGDRAEACPKFEASLKLDPALGTLLNLAHCYEQVGRLASAWARYRELGDLAERAGQAPRAQFARMRAADLEPRLPRFTIRVPVAAHVPRLAVTRDGVAVDPTLFGTPVYVDPGVYELKATAPGREAFETTITAVEAEEATVSIPELTPVPEPPTREPTERKTELETVSRRAPETDSRQAPGSDSHQAPGMVSIADDAPSTGRGRRILGLSTGGVGLAVLAAGLGSGWSASSTWNRAFEQGLCDRDTLVCTSDGQAQADIARSRATLSNVLIGAGVGLATVGVVLYVTAPESRNDPRAARLVPTIGPEAFGFALSGDF